mgnify:CR=1 FL=1
MLELRNITLTVDRDGEDHNLLDNVIDARHRLLAPHGRILPSRFRLFVEPMSLRSDMRVRRLHNIDLPDGIRVRLDTKLGRLLPATVFGLSLSASAASRAATMRMYENHMSSATRRGILHRPFSASAR